MCVEILFVVGAAIFRHAVGGMTAAIGVCIPNTPTPTETNMKTSTKKTGLAIKTSIKAGGLCTSNHNRAAASVR